jgi:hypothetical protein
MSRQTIIPTDELCPVCGTETGGKTCDDCIPDEYLGGGCHRYSD